MEFKNLSIHYLNNDPNGVKVCELETSMVQALVFPRDLLSKAKEVGTELSKHGIYFLIENKDGRELPRMYAGQTRNGVEERFRDHKQKKDYWDLAVLFVARGSDWGLDIIDGLEKLAIDAIVKSNRYTGDNVIIRKTPEKRKGIDYRKQAISQYFDDVKFIMGALGWPLDPTDISKPHRTEEVWLIQKGSIVGHMRIAGEKYEVMPGSQIDLNSEPTANETAKKLRESLLSNDDIYEDANGSWKLRKIISFNSPSGAAVFVLGGSLDGWKVWKNSEGKTLDTVRKSSS